MIGCLPWWGTPPQAGQSCGNPPGSPMIYCTIQHKGGIRDQFVALPENHPPPENDGNPANARRSHRTGVSKRHSKVRKREGRHNSGKNNCRFTMVPAPPPPFFFGISFFLGKHLRIFCRTTGNNGNYCRYSSPNLPLFMVELK